MLEAEKPACTKPAKTLSFIVPPAASKYPFAFSSAHRSALPIQGGYLVLLDGTIAPPTPQST